MNDYGAEKLFRSNCLKDPIRCSVVTEKCSDLLHAINITLKKLKDLENITELKTKNGYKYDHYDYMDFKITGLLSSKGN